MELSEMERLVALVQNAHISELTLREGASRITIRKTPSAPEASDGALIAYPYAHDETADYETSVETVYAEQAKDTPVFAPLVGIFHHVKPMVGLGAKVSAGQVIGIIEAMKLINELAAPSAGLVTDLLIEDGMPVEYGQTLFLIRPEG